MGKTQYNELAIAKMTKKQLEKVFYKRKERLEAALKIWEKANPKKVEKEKE